MKKKPNTIQRDILFILISSFIVVVAWIGFNLYHIWATSSVSVDIQSKLTPIDGSFDAATIQQLKTRKQISPLYELQQPTTKSAPTLVTPTVSPSSEEGRFTPTNTPISITGQ